MHGAQNLLCFFGWQIATARRCDWIGSPSWRDPAVLGLDVFETEEFFFSGEPPKTLTELGW